MIRKFFTSFDLFGAAPTLRMRGESETINLCGGIFSLVLLLVFVYVFVDQAYRIGTFQEIEAKTTIEVYFSNTETLTQ